METVTKQKPTFVIGLGGTGFKIVHTVARMFVNACGKVPDHVLLRSFDIVDQKGNVSGGVLAQHNLTQLGPFDANGIVRNRQYHPQVARWWRYEDTPGFVSAGAGAKRPVGRLAFFSQANQVFSALNDDFRRPLQFGNSISNTPQVFIICSVAGGTGSGLFIDFAFVARHLLQKCGYAPGGTNIQALLGLPSIVEVVDGAGQLPVGQRRRVNAYGALRELDFLMQGSIPSDFELQYPEPIGSFRPTPPVFNQVYLFSAQNMGGYVLKEEEVLQRVARAVYTQIESQIGGLAQELLVNEDPDPNHFKGGLFSIYRAFGTEWLEVPARYLLDKAIEKLGAPMTEALKDFSGARDDQRNLERVVSERMTGRMAPYANAAQIVQLDPVEVATRGDLAAATPFLQEINDARKRDEIRSALSRLQSALPAITTAIRARLSAPTEKQEQEWMADLAQGLVADPLFRVAGAGRVLRECAKCFRRIASPPRLDLRPIEDVIADCGGRLLRAINPEPALRHAREMLTVRVRQTVQEMLAQRAGRLAVQCDDLANQIDRFKSVIDEAQGHLAATAVTAPPDADRATWLIPPEQIERALDEKHDAMIDAIADEVARRMADEIQRSVLAGGAYGWDALVDRMTDWMRHAMERQLASATARPPESVDLLKRRMEQCQPLLRIDTTGPVFQQVMRGREPTPVKIAFRGVPDPEPIAELQDWAHQQSIAISAPNAFQVSPMPVPEPLRDDVFYVTRGWPLWMFEEVRDCAAAADKARDESPATYELQLMMNEIPGAQNHDIRPLDKAGTDIWLGVALLRKDVALRTTTGEFVFSDNVFPHGGGEGNPARNFRAAEERFSSFALDYGAAAEQRINADTAAEREFLLQKTDLWISQRAEFSKILGHEDTDRLFRILDAVRSYAEKLPVLSF